MRARGIKPGFYKNEQLATCSMAARLLFPGLWMLADKNGCLEYRPLRWKAEVFPYDSVDCAALFSELEKAGLVVRYHVNGVDYVFILKFRQHQNPHKNEADSDIPPYLPEHSSNYASTPEVDRVTRADSLTPSSLTPEVKDSSLRSESSCPGSGEPDEQNYTPSGTVPGSEKPKKKPKVPLASLPEDSEPYRLAVYMRDQLKANLPTLKEPDLQKWARDFDVALRNDERMADARFVAQVVRWVANDGFWRANCQCPAKLREKLDQLTAKMEVEAARCRASPLQSAPAARTQAQKNKQNLEGLAAFVNAADKEFANGYDTEDFHRTGPNGPALPAGSGRTARASGLGSGLGRTVP